MPSLVGLLFAVSGVAIVAADCTSEGCHDETSLVQVKATLMESKPHHGSDLQESNPFLEEGPSVNAFFDSKDDLVEAMAKAAYDPKCLKPDKVAAHGGYPKCKTDHSSSKLPCDECIDDQWATNSGAGNKCCAAISKTELEKAPLCGICARFEKKGLHGKHDPDAKKNADQSRFDACAEYYCAAAKKTPDKAMLDGIAKHCSPDATKNPTKPGKDMIGIVANNPMKHKLATFLEKETKTVDKVIKAHGNITGTDSSSKMASCITGAKKSSFSTFSGPWGGDAQLAGLLAMQKQGSVKPPYVKAVIFFDEPNEAHHLDIIALKAVMEATMPAGSYSFDETKAKKLLTDLR